jgi:hypothetical protein
MSQIHLCCVQSGGYAVIMIRTFHAEVSGKVTVMSQ